MLAVSAVLYFDGLRADPKAMTGDGWLPLKTFIFLMRAFCLLLTLPINDGILFFALIRNKRIQHLEASGIRRTATMEKRQVIPYSALGQVRVGGTIDVLADLDQLMSARGIEILLD